MAAKWDPPDPHDLIRRYQAGEGTVKLGKLYGVSHETVRRALHRLGAQTRARGEPYASPLPDGAADRYLAGESVLKLSRELGIGRGALTLRLRRSGIEIRGADQQPMNPYASRCRSALTSEMRQSAIGKHEAEIATALRERGHQAIQQRAVGPYNIDVAVLPIAVEILGSDWQFSPDKRAMRRERVEYLLRRGWAVIEVLIRARAKLTPAGVDEIVAFIEQVRREPPSRGQYRVIRGNGKDATARCSCLDQLADVPPSHR